MQVFLHLVWSGIGVKNSWILRSIAIIFRLDLLETETKETESWSHTLKIYVNRSVVAGEALA